MIGACGKRAYCRFRRMRQRNPNVIRLTSRLLDLIERCKFTDLDRLNVKITTESLEQALHMRLVSADAVLALDGNPTKADRTKLIAVVAESVAGDPKVSVDRLREMLHPQSGDEAPLMVVSDDEDPDEELAAHMGDAL